MSWPRKVYRPQDPNADDMGMVDFSPPLGPSGQYGVEKGLPENWQSMEKTKKIEKVSAWDVVGGNPLYEAAAGALGINWDKFRENFRNEIGDEDEYERPGVESTVTDEDEGEDKDEDKDEPYDWGITHEGIESDLNEMQGWLIETIDKAGEKKGYGGGGPSGEDWGIEGDIWKTLGLDQPPQDPQPLAADMFKYKDSPSNYTQLEHYAGHPDTDANPWLDAGVWLGNNPNFSENREFGDVPPDRKQSHADWAAKNTAEVNAQE